MDPESAPPRRSPRIVELARLREQTESDKEKQNQLRRAQYNAKQASITESERQARNEKRRIDYRAKVAAAKAQPHGHGASSSGEHTTESSFIPYQDEQAAEGTRKRKGKFIAPQESSFIPNQDEQAAEGTQKKKVKFIAPQESSFIPIQDDQATEGIPQQEPHGPNIYVAREALPTQLDIERN